MKKVATVVNTIKLNNNYNKMSTVYVV